MNKKLVFSVLLVCILALSLVFVGCDTGGGSGGTGTGTGNTSGRDTKLVGTWSDNTAEGYTNNTCTYIFKSDGTVSGGVLESSGATWSTSGNTLSVNTRGGVTTATYAVSETTLTISNRSDSSLRNGTFTKQ